MSGPIQKSCMSSHLCVDILQEGIEGLEGRDWIGNRLKRQKLSIKISLISHLPCVNWFELSTDRLFKRFLMNNIIFSYFRESISVKTKSNSFALNGKVHIVVVAKVFPSIKLHDYFKTNNPLKPKQKTIELPWFEGTPSCFRRFHIPLLAVDLLKRDGRSSRRGIPFPGILDIFGHFAETNAAGHFVQIACVCGHHHSLLCLREWWGRGRSGLIWLQLIGSWTMPEGLFVAPFPEEPLRKRRKELRPLSMVRPLSIKLIRKGFKL